MLNVKALNTLTQMGAIALAIAAATNFGGVTPVHAEAVNDVIGGGGGTGRPDGGGSRGCFDDDDAAPREMLALTPRSTAKTTQANPEIVLYMPFERSDEDFLRLEFQLKREVADSTDFDVVIEPTEILLPEQPGLYRFQLPEGTQLEVGPTYEWSFFLWCDVSAALTARRTNTTVPPRQNIPDTASETTGAGALPELTIADHDSDDAPNPGNFDIYQESFGTIERVPVTPELTTTLADADPSEHAATYLEFGIWFEAVTAMAEFNPTAWAELLDAFAEEYDIDVSNASS